MAVLLAHGALTAERAGIALNRLGLSSLALMVSAQVSGELLYPGKIGRLLCVLARLVLLPATLALFVASLHPAFGAYGLLAGIAFLLFLAGLVWIVARFSGLVRGRRG